MSVNSEHLFHEADRLMTICNSCRYCEGYCAVFPAMERRTGFTPETLRHLANLCHNCGECLYACQYAPPHPFGVNIPKTLAEVRLESYQHYAWPAPFAAAFQANGTVISILLVLLAGGAIFFGIRIPPPQHQGDFYAIVPHATMVTLFGAVGLFAALALTIGVLRFWRELKTGPINGRALRLALGDILTLRNLGSGEAGCTYPDEHRSLARRRFHHLTAGGFALCFASTTVAAAYHVVFGWVAPYGYGSLPVILGTMGGLGLLVGPTGLLALKTRHDPDLSDSTQKGLDTSFLGLLLVASLSGLLLLIFRASAAMPALLSAHLASILVLFLALPYGKFVHGIYRSAALLRDAIERVQEINY